MSLAQRHTEVSISEDDMARIATRMRRIFMGSFCLTVLIIGLFLLLMTRWWYADQALQAAFAGILLWSVVVSAYGFYSQATVTDKVSSMLRRKTFQDEVTGVFNYRYLDMRLAEEAERTRRHGGLTAVLYVDLDNFKRVNDTYGHQIGNIVLKQIATIMSQKVRLCDVFGRIGGDEFLAILPHTDRREAGVLADRLCKAIECYSLEMGKEDAVDFVRVSIGIAAFPVNGETMENVVTAADKAVYEAKSKGGNQVCVAGDFVASDPWADQIIQSVRGESSPLQGKAEPET